MSSSGIDFSDDMSVNIARLAEKIKVEQDNSERFKEAIFGNGKEGIKESILGIHRDIQEINSNMDDNEQRRRNNEMSKRWKIGLAVGVALAVVSDWLPAIAGAFQ